VGKLGNGNGSAVARRLALAAALAATVAGATASNAAESASSAPAAPSVGIVAPADEPGRRIVLQGRVIRGGSPVAGLEVHAFQADAGGRYDEDGGPGAPGSRLSTTVRTDADGRFELRTIRPGRYPQGAPPPAHVHLVLRPTGGAEKHTEVLFADDPALAEPRWQGWVARSGFPVVTLDGSREPASAEFSIELP
jgi:protocatechuate 3,4-dioxygenase beta subunit